jgi:dihydropteroate synthase
LLTGRAAGEAVASGVAAFLAGGPIAFSLARLPEDRRIVPIREVPEPHRPALARLSAPPPPWAGLPVDRPAVMGILNVTPDSFSDGGLHLAAERAIAAGRAMAEAGADIVDVGGESTRPGALGTPAEEEQARILPVVRALAGAGVRVSVDTRHATTMQAALDAGAVIVNDVSGLTYDPEAAALVAARCCPVVLMHMRGEPATMMQQTDYADVARDVARELALRREAAVAAGIGRARIALDPGFGFAKGRGQNEDLLARLPLLLNLGCRLVVGLSRKGVIGRLSGEQEPRRRLPGSLAAGLLALLGGATVLRVHDVPETVQALRVWHAIIAPSLCNPTGNQA